MKNYMERNRSGLLAAVVLPCVAWGLHVAVPPMAMPASPPEWACRSSWNLMRLTRRGTDVPAECFDVSFRYNMLHLIFR